MRQQYFITRTIELDHDSDNFSRPLLLSLSQLPGVNRVEICNESHHIEVEYDQQHLGFLELIELLEQYGAVLKKGVKFRILSQWFDYIDSTVRDNALAPPPACCNKPPKKH